MAVQLHFGAGDSVTFGSTDTSPVGTSQSFNKASLGNLAVGDLLIAWFGGQSGTGNDEPVAPSGWVRCGVASGVPTFAVSRNSAMWYYAIIDQVALDAIPSVVTWNFHEPSAQVARGAFVVARATGVDLVHPIDGVSTEFTNANNTTTLSIPEISVQTDGALLVGGVFRHNAAGSGIPGIESFMTQYEEYCTTTNASIANTAGILGYSVVSLAGSTGPRQITYTASATTTSGQLVAFRPLNSIPTRPFVVTDSIVTALAGQTVKDTAFTIEKPVGLVDGDLLVVTVSAQTSTSTADFACTGWTRIGTEYIPSSVGYRLTGIYAKPVAVAASETASSYTFVSTDPTGGRIAAASFIVRHADLSSITASAPVLSGNGNGSTLSTAVGAPMANNSLLVMAFNAQFTAGNSYEIATAPLGMSSMVATASVTIAGGSSTPLYVYSQDVDAQEQGLRSITYVGTPAQMSSATVYIRALGEPDISPGDGRKTYVVQPGGNLSETMGAHYVDTTGHLLPAEEMRPFPDGYSSVSAMLAQSPFFVAHRGGSRDWPEMSLYAYTQAGYWGTGAFEVSLARTADGVWFGLHDWTLDRTSLGAATSTLQAYAMTWEEVQQYQICGAAASNNPTQQNRPYARFEEIVAAYYPSHVLFIDIKDAVAYTDEFIAMLAGLPGSPQQHIVGKAYGVSANYPNKMRAAGYKTWGYFYQTDVESGNLAAYESYWDIIGMDYQANAASWAAAGSYNKPVVAHIIQNASSYAIAANYQPDGYMVASVKAVVPRKK
ncbi:MAG: glycerophosphodiester phosphodiesterase family protein [Candidatus Saccharimonas sp.]